MMNTRLVDQLNSMETILARALIFYNANSFAQNWSLNKRFPYTSCNVQ